MSPSIVGRLKDRLWRETWNVVIVALRPEELIGQPGGASAIVTRELPAEASWLFPHEPGVFHADPFLLARGADLFLFCERFDARIGRGVIVAGALERVGVEGAGGWRIRDVGEVRLPGAEDAHLSYPCVFAHDGELFMIPELSAAGEIALYRAHEVPFAWERVCTLVPGFAGLDPTPLRHEGRWWLMAGKLGPAEWRELYLFGAGRLEGPWRASPGNPVVTGYASSRPAGLPFAVAGALYRPAQDCRGTYGEAVNLMRIDRLDADGLSETRAGRLAPAPRSRYPHGLHQISFAPGAGVAAVDGKAYRGAKAGFGPLYAGLRRRRRA